MKIIGITGEHKDEYIAQVSHEELEKFLGVYYGGLHNLKVNDTVDLGRGYNFLKEIKDAFQKTKEFIEGHEKIIKAITEGIAFCKGEVFREFNPDGKDDLEVPF